jgi:mRNA-degrading endonuclease toxin of MazEF toxin-antitoxin module
LTHDSLALREPIRVIDLSRLMTGLGAFSSQRMQEVADALKIFLEL